MVGRALTGAIAVAGFLVSTSVMAATVLRDMPACASEDLLSEAIRYAIKGDNNGFLQLVLSGECTMLTRGDSVSVIRSGFSVATIRYQGHKLYTPSEAVR